ncbi:MAG: DNA translocase FtsK [Chloroflexi bacterium]|nr:DNA translocase FtsK [Chloroflexota bacterium]
MARLAKKKAAHAAKKPSGKSRGSSSSFDLRRFFASPVLWRFLIVAGLGYGIYWASPHAYLWSQGVATTTLRSLGYGIIITAIAVGGVVFLIWRGFKPFLRHWNHWLGAAAFLTAVWALLAFFYTSEGIWSEASLGGYAGQGLLHSPDIIGALRVAGFALLGFLLVTPRGTVRAFKAGGKGLFLALRGAWRMLRGRHTVPVDVRQVEEAATPEAPEPLQAGAEAQPVNQPPKAAKAEPKAEAKPAASAPAETIWRKLASKSVLTPSGWQLPAPDTLEKGSEKVVAHADNNKRAKLIEEALSSYGVEAKVVEINVGPAVTQFGVEPGWDRKFKEIKEKDGDGNVTVRHEEVSRTRVKVERIASLANDLALNLGASTLRIEAPIPGKSVVGIEVPNTVSGVVTLRSVVESSAFQKVKARSRLALALGKAAGGEAVAADLAKMPHLLIAGATGSGKTVCLNTIIASILMYNTPQDVQFLMVDPKRVELVAFNSIPHLVAPVVVESEKSVDVLHWLIGEMDRRYEIFGKVSVRNIEGFHEKQPGMAMPYLVLVVDELADLMMTASDEVERLLCRLAQLARATGIHLVVATQRPSVDVITGLIKANFPTRISFAVTSQVDSRTILDSVGAEKLLGRGDMLFMPTDAAKPRRVQGCFISDQEIEKVVFFWNSQQGLVTPIKVKDFTAANPGAEGGPEDPMLAAARRLAQEHRHISASFLQRRLGVGYARAAHLMDLLEKEKGKDDDDGEAEGTEAG